MKLSDRKMSNKNNSLANLLLVSSLTFIISGCAVTTSVEENPSVSELPPMEKPTYSANQRIIELDNVTEKERYYDITEVRSDGSFAGINQNGCSWENYGDLVSPALSWTNCSDDPEWHSGENRDIKKKGEIWPLAVGNKVSYTYAQINARGENTGRTTRKCKVDDIVNIGVAAGQLDTYKVTCKRVKGSWSQTHVFYFSPEFNSSTKYVRSSSSEGVQSDRELLRIENI